MSLSINDLPWGVVVYIANKLSDKDILSISSTSRKFNALIRKYFNEYLYVQLKNHYDHTGILLIEKNHDMYDYIYERIHRGFYDMVSYGKFLSLNTQPITYVYSFSYRLMKDDYRWEYYRTKDLIHKRLLDNIFKYGNHRRTYSDIRLCIKDMYTQLNTEFTEHTKHYKESLFGNYDIKNENDLLEDVRSSMDCEWLSDKMTRVYKWANLRDSYIQIFIYKFQTTTRKEFDIQLRGYMNELVGIYPPKYQRSGLVEYITHDNGGRPFKVVDLKETCNAVILKNSWNNDINDEYKEWVCTYIYQRMLIGRCDPRLPNDTFNGNSVLIHLAESVETSSTNASIPTVSSNGAYTASTPDRYVYVGDQVYEFSAQPDDAIIEYYSPIGNNDVPYPYAIGEKYVYFVLDRMCIKLEDIPIDIMETPCVVAYNFFYKTQKPKINFVDVKFIHLRIF